MVMLMVLTMLTMLLALLLTLLHNRFAWTHVWKCGTAVGDDFPCGRCYPLGCKYVATTWVHLIPVAKSS